MNNHVFVESADHRRFLDQLEKEVIENKLRIKGGENQGLARKR